MTTSSNHSPSKSKLQAITATRPWKFTDWLVLSIGVILIIASLFAWQFFSTYHTFLSQAGLTSDELFSLYRQSQSTPIANDQGHINFLILGTDTLEYRDNDHPLTDTIMLASLDLDQATVKLLPIPRDLFLPEYGSRVNAIYAQFLTADPTTALPQTIAALSQTFDLPIHYGLVVSMQDVADFLTLIGGVEVDITNSFTDHQFPRVGVDITTVTDPAQLYETVTFEAGLTQLDAATALKFIRSRHGDGVEGNDYARSTRQQQVITAATTKIAQLLSSQLRAYDFSFLGQLYKFYDQRFSQQVPFVELLAIARHLLSHNQLPTLTSHSLKIDPVDSSANIAENLTDWSLQIVNRPGLLAEIKAKLLD